MHDSYAIRLLVGVKEENQDLVIYILEKKCFQDRDTPLIDKDHKKYTVWER